MFLVKNSNTSAKYLKKKHPSIIFSFKFQKINFFAKKKLCLRSTLV